MAPRIEGQNGNETEDELFLRQPVKELEDKWKLVPAFLKTRGLVKVSYAFVSCQCTRT